jgi:hypothetical protein
MRRALRTMLPTSVLQLLNTDGQEPMPFHIVNKINEGERHAKVGNDWLRGVERNLAHQKLPVPSAVVHDTGLTSTSTQDEFGYGSFDPRMSVSSYKSMLRGIPPPWNSITKSSEKDEAPRKPAAVNDILGGELHGVRT